MAVDFSVAPGTIPAITSPKRLVDAGSVFLDPGCQRGILGVTSWSASSRNPKLICRLVLKRRVVHGVLGGGFRLLGLLHDFISKSTARLAAKHTVPAEGKCKGCPVARWAR